MEIIKQFNERYNSFVECCDNHYDEWGHICDDLSDKYKNASSDKTHICVFMNIKNNNIIIGENTYNTITKISTHAEMNALSKIEKYNNYKTIGQRQKYDILVIRIGKTGKLGISRPCYHCINSLQNSNVKIRNVFYSTKTGKIVKEKLSEMNDQSFTHISAGWIYRLCGVNKHQLNDFSNLQNNNKIYEIYKRFN